MNAIIFDTETTDADAPVIVEAAYLHVRSLMPFDAGDGWCGRFNPGKPISYGAMATHNITLDELDECPPASSFALPSGTQYVIGHKVDFDLKAIGDPPVKRICTLALARWLWPTLDTHTQMAVLYFVNPLLAKQKAASAHSAATDVTVCRAIASHICEQIKPQSIEDLWLASERARIPEIMSFGKHKGMRVADVPADYKRWLLGQPDVDPYLAKALRGQRAAA